MPIFGRTHLMVKLASYLIFKTALPKALSLWSNRISSKLKSSVHAATGPKA